MEDKIVRYTLRVDRLLFKIQIYCRERGSLCQQGDYLKRELQNLKKKTAKSKQRINKIFNIIKSG